MTSATLRLKSSVATLESAEARVRECMRLCDVDAIRDCTAAEIDARTNATVEALQDYWRACREVAALERVAGAGCVAGDVLVDHRGKG